LSNTTSIAEQPNILIFMTDQQRGDSAPPYGRAKMPNLERFAAEGVSFSETYGPAPHCCPSRATFFTGLYPAQHGVWNNVNVGNTLSRGLKRGLRLFSDDLAAAGYDLRYSGKWHVSTLESPRDRGWTMRYPEPELLDNSGIYADYRSSSHWERYRELAASEPVASEPVAGSQPVVASAPEEGAIERPGYGTFRLFGTRERPSGDRKVVDDAIEHLSDWADTDTAVCQYVGPIGPHDPYFVPKEFLDLYDPADIELPENFTDDVSDKPRLYQRTRDRYQQLTPDEHREAIRHYLAYCTYEDALFGEVLDALEKTGKADNTIVLFISDHGDYAGEHGMWTKGLPCFRSAYHVPALVRWPAGVRNPGRVCEEMVSLADFAPTFLEAAGISEEEHRRAGSRTLRELAGDEASEHPEMVGRSLMPFLRDESPADWRDELHTQSNGNELYGIQRSVMTNKWKFVYNGYDYDELYDLESDPGEVRNLLGGGPLGGRWEGGRRIADVDTGERTEPTPDLDPVVRDLMQRIWRFSHRTNDVCINPYIMVSFAPYGPALAFETTEK
jgi:arylsulfatase A-like enzyme